MKRGLILAVAATAGLIALTGCATTGSPSTTSEASPRTSQTGGWMLVQTANTGVTFTKTGDSTYLATLTGVSPTTVAFSDRPSCQARQITTMQVAESWSQRFVGSAPNAALVNQVARSSQAVIVQLSDPKHRPEEGKMTYQVRLVDPGQISSGLQLFTDNALPQPQDSTLKSACHPFRSP